MKTPSFTRWPSDVRYSALLTFRYWRKTLGVRQAYWLTLFRFGWSSSAEYAFRNMNPQTRLAHRIA